MCTVDDIFVSFSHIVLAAAKTKSDNDEREPEYSHFNAMTCGPFEGEALIHIDLLSLKPRIFSQDYMKPAARGGGDAG